MRPRSAAIVACRIIALLFGLEAAIQLITFIFLVRSIAGSAYFWAGLGARLVVAYVLWITAERLGDAMARGTDESSGSLPSAASIQTIAFTVVGVVLIVQAIPALVEVVASRAADLGPFAPLRSTSSWFVDRAAGITGALIRLALGIALVLGARPLTDALRRRDPPEPTA